MNKRFLQSIFCAFLLTFSASSFAQVTIGSSIAPNSGALLDLKQQNETTAGGVTSNLGLMLPRVELKSLEIDGTTYTNLSQTIDGATGNWNKDEHIGLLVYNVNRCIGLGAGLYIWNGTEWTPMHKRNNFDLTLSQTYFDLPSGLDARGPVSAQDLVINWSGTTAPTWSTAADDGFTAVGLTTPTATGSLGASPYTMSILPTTMNTTTEVTTDNPWYSKQTKLTFLNLPECGPQNFVTLNQTNYALKVNSEFTNSQITSRTPTSQFQVKGNATWTTSIDDPNNVLVLPLATPSGGTNKTTTGAAPAENFAYTTQAGSKYYSANITFKDDQSPKRYEDITVSIFNCDDTTNPTIEQFALRAGFTQAEINAVKTTGTDSRILATGLQMHRQVSSARGANQIFLSSNFGANPEDSDQRWMVHNLDAIAYDGIAHSEGRVLTGPNGATSYNIAYWAYPKSSGTITVGEAASTEFTNNQRLGLLYNWDAATAGKGGANGQGNNVNEGASNAYAQVQGICPSGWHLPSDQEFTDLESVMSGTNSINFSTTADATSATTLGNVWKDICEPFLGANQGTSNGINSLLRPGFDVLLAGLAVNGSAYDYGRYAYLWSSSSSGGNAAWSRDLNNGNAGVYRSASASRRNLFSVRCKKG